jgi:SARP family transcriptional regulator, regulator of embCAB operon
VRYDLLGPLRVVNGGDNASISAQKVEILLAILLIRSDRVVTADQLMAEIWGERLPRRATAGLHVYVSELRKFLGRHRAESPIVTCSPGYVLRQGSDEIDFQSFLSLLESGRKSARKCLHEEASDYFERALALWRGPVLRNAAAGPIVSSFVTWLSEERVECLEQMIEAQLRLDRHRELVGMLYSLIAEHPLREAFYRQLMLALYRSNRKADALRVYRSARSTLQDELGLEPCRTLQDIQHAILHGNDQLLEHTLAA